MMAKLAIISWPQSTYVAQNLQHKGMRTGRGLIDDKNIDGFGNLKLEARIDKRPSKFSLSNTR